MRRNRAPAGPAAALGCASDADIALSVRLGDFVEGALSETKETVLYKRVYTLENLS
jgi:hypothetical protein